MTGDSLNAPFKSSGAAALGRGAAGHELASVDHPVGGALGEGADRERRIDRRWARHDRAVGDVEARIAVHLAGVADDAGLPRVPHDAPPERVPREEPAHPPEE